MKILHLTAGNLYGGVERVLATLARHRDLQPDLHQEFAQCYRGPSFAELEQTGVPVHELGAVRASRPWTVLRARRRLRQLIQREDYDVVLVHSCWAQALFGPTVRRSGIRLATWIHDVLQGGPWVETLAARIPTDVLIANSQFTLAAARKALPHRHGVVITYPPVGHGPIAEPGPIRAQIRNSLGTSEGRIVLLMLSRLDPYKGHRVFLKALGEISDLPGWEAWLTGSAQRPQEEQYLAELQQSVQVQGLTNRVRFLGHRNDPEAVLAAADILCQPNTTPEAFGLIFVEALAQGRPVVTSRLGGAIEIVDDSCARLVTPGAVDELAAALRELVQDENLRLRLGEQGRARATRFLDVQTPLAQLHQALTAA